MARLLVTEGDVRAKKQQGASGSQRTLFFLLRSVRSYSFGSGSGLLTVT